MIYHRGVMALLPREVSRSRSASPSLAPCPTNGWAGRRAHRKAFTRSTLFNGRRCFTGHASTTLSGDSDTFMGEERPSPSPGGKERAGF